MNIRKCTSKIHKIKWLFTIFLVMLLYVWVPGQYMLLKNDNDIIPFKDLSDLSIQVIAIGERLDANLASSLISRYKEVEHVISFSEFEPWDIPLLYTHSVCFIRYSDTSVFRSRYDDLVKIPGLTVIFTGSKPLDHPEISTILYSSTDQLEDLDRVVQSIFGATPFMYKLSQSFGDFPPGSGLETRGGIRLGYSPDGIEGINLKQLSDSLDLIIGQGLDSGAYPGAQVLVAYQGSVIFEKAYGFHSYDSLRPVSLTDVYDLASITKVSTAIPSLMWLIDQGRLSLDDPLCKHLPYFCKSDKGELTFRRMLAHYARLMPYIVYWRQAVRKNGKFKCRTFRTKSHANYPVPITDSLFMHKKFKRRVYKAVRKSDLNPTFQYVYSGLSFLLYPDIVSQLTNTSIDTFLYREFYGPLGANRLLYNPIERLPLEEIIPAEIDTSFRRQLVHGRVHDEASAVLGGISCNAGLFGNARDLAKLYQMFLNKGEYGGTRFFSPYVVDAFTRCQYCEEGVRRGLGFDKPLIEGEEGGHYASSLASAASYGHSGFTGTFFWVDPEYDMIFILLTNRVHPTRANGKIYQLDIRERAHSAVYTAME